MSDSYKSFDAVFAAVLTAYQNAGLAACITVGDELYVRAAGLASVAWGLYRESEWTKNQIWPDSASEDNLIHWGGVYGLSKNAGESFAAFLDRVLKRWRNKEGGGNKTDCENWAMEVSYGSESASSAKCYGGVDAYGPGTGVLVITKSDGTDPSSALLDAIKSYVLQKGPVEPAELYVVAPTKTSVAVSLKMSGGDTALAASLIQAFMAALSTGQVVYPEVFKAFCWQAGATNVTLLSPTEMTAPSKFGKVVASSISVTA